MGRGSVPKCGWGSIDGFWIGDKHIEGLLYTIWSTFM